MARPKFFRDPLHLQIRFERDDAGQKVGDADVRASSILQRLIDTPEFQRLRYIRQNGLANLVFHGAEHSRFTHSLGVMHVAKTMYERICRNMSEAEDDNTKTLVLIASLIHDVGHGPFSHTMEEILNENGAAFHHENMTLRFISDPASSINRILTELDPAIPNSLTPFFDKAKRIPEHWSYRLVSSQMDADRLDYVQRDALFAGLKGHGFDIERVFDLLYHHNNSIAVDRGAIEAVESYLVTIDQLYRAIYYHHAVRAATQMLMSLFRRAIWLYKGGDLTIFPSIGGAHPIVDLLNHGDQIPLSSYSRLTDFMLWSLIVMWQFHRDDFLSSLSKRVLNRVLFKTIDLDTSRVKHTQSVLDQARKSTDEIYGKDSNEYYVMVDEPSRTSYKGYDWRPDAPDDSIWLIKGSKSANPLEDEDDNTVVRAFKVKKHFPWLIVPADVRERMKPP